METSLSRTFLDLHNHRIFKTRGETLASLSLAPHVTDEETRVDRIKVVLPEVMYLESGSVQNRTLVSWLSVQSALWPL